MSFVMAVWLLMCRCFRNICIFIIVYTEPTESFKYLPDLKNSFSEENDVFAMPLS